MVVSDTIMTEREPICMVQLKVLTLLQCPSFKPHDLVVSTLSLKFECILEQVIDLFTPRSVASHNRPLE